jgi:glycosyltransferase involved in cell wall biosynthesis
MMPIKLFIQIPCFNEEKTLPDVIADLPVRIEGVDEIYTLVIDDGSNDRTIDTARKIGVDYIVRNHRNIGLARTFQRGLEACLHLGADIIVNTDGDNQYRGQDIHKLVRPIVEKRVDVSVGCRNIDANPEFSWLKKKLHKIGSRTVRFLSGLEIPDATSGFRAVSREAAVRFAFMSRFSYTLEMLIQAGSSGLKVDCVPVGMNPRSRDSRLFKSIPQFILRQLKIMITIFIFYRPMYFFGLISLAFFAVSLFLGSRIAYYLWFSDPELMKFKSGSGTLLLITSVFSVVFLIAGLLGSVLSGLRFLCSDVRTRLRSYELQQEIRPLDIEIIPSPKFFRWASGSSHRPNVTQDLR